jgi:PQQ-dependent catabolism-associated beta-propeller protein
MEMEVPNAKTPGRKRTAGRRSARLRAGYGGGCGMDEGTSRLPGLTAALAAGAIALLTACGAREAPPAAEAATDAQASATPVSLPDAGSTPPHRIFVSNEMSGDMTVIDGRTLQVIATVPLGKRPRGIQLSPDGTRIFVALSGSPIGGPDVDDDDLPPADKSADGIGVVDAKTLKLLRVIRGVSDPEQLVVSADGRRLYIASEDTGMAVVVDAETGETLAQLPVGGEPEGVGISPDGRFVYMTSEEDHQVSVIDTGRNEVVAQFKVGERPRSVSFTADSARAYVTGEFDGTVSVVDARAHKVIDTIKLAGENVRPMEVDLSPDGSRVFVTTGRGKTVVAIDASTHQVVGSVTVGERPWGLAVSPDGKRLYTANGPSNDISVVDASTLTVIAKVPVGARPWGVVVGPESPEA